VQLLLKFWLYSVIRVYRAAPPEVSCKLLKIKPLMELSGGVQALPFALAQGWAGEAAPLAATGGIAAHPAAPDFESAKASFRSLRFRT
jgi:hypothetical protein